TSGMLLTFRGSMLQNVGVRPNRNEGVKRSGIYINQENDTFLRERREILKRVCEFENYSSLWDTDRLKAKGLVSEIRDVIKVKDAFTRMQQERDKEAKKHTDDYNKKIEEIKKKKEEIEIIKKDFYSLFSENNPQSRGIKLEGVLNRFFNSIGILVREAFKRNGEVGEGTIEQIDGVVEIDTRIYLVEMKWRKDTIGGEDMFGHLGRIYHRSNAHGIYISASGYSPAAITAAKDALTRNAMIVLCNLEEFVKVLEAEQDFVRYIRLKIQSAIIDKEPFTQPI
ncbi:MAG: restriction endonuclease, partial [Haliscomenobacteraceae bacterium CHB4]|nr:restriction endonuclease [Haliscomenobacteraceae bacterium CHB4]